LQLGGIILINEKLLNDDRNGPIAVANVSHFSGFDYVLIALGQHRYVMDGRWSAIQFQKIVGDVA
jgi:hypothetical protein